MSSRRSGPGLAFDQTFAQAAPDSQSPLEASHRAVIALVIIAKEMQQAVQGQDAELRAEAVAGGSRLALRNTMRNHDIAELTRLIGRERQDVRRSILPPVSAIQLHARGGRDHRDRDRTPGAPWRNRPSHAASPAARTPARQHHGDRQTG